MKFKLKAKPQDWLIFAIFAVALWFIIAIFVNNINSFASTGSFAGLNPIPGMVNHFSACLVFYIAAFIVIMTSLKDYFFEKEKGFGIKFGSKEENSFSRLRTEKEVKEVLQSVKLTDDTYDAAGVPIINDGKRMWVDNKESHNIIIGSTGSGKTQDIVHPMVKALARKGESMIITDPKGEIYEESASLLKQKGYKIVVLNFRDPQKGNCWNPLALPYQLYKNGNTDKAMELLDDVASNILYEEGNKDPFWEKTAADYFVGLTLGLFEDAAPEQININSVSLMTSIGEEKFGPRSTYIKEYFNGKDPSSAAYISASGTVFAPEDTKGSILSTMRQKIRIFASRENLSEMLSRSDFDMDTIGTQKTAVFLVIQDEKKTYHALATIFIKQCYESLIGAAQNLPGGHLTVRTNFILDEFANMPPLKDVTTMITAARSRWVRFTMIIQNFAQLDSIYGKENAQTIRSNCNNLIYLLTTELSALKEISELSGERRVKVGKGDKEHEETRPLITVSELQQMKENEAVLIRIRMGTAKVHLYPNWKTNWGYKKQDADPFVQRERQAISVFNLKDYMEKQKQNKYAEMINGGGSANPFGNSGGNVNPFANMSGVNPFASLFDSTPNNKPEVVKETPVITQNDINKPEPKIEVVPQSNESLDNSLNSVNNSVLKPEISEKPMFNIPNSNINKTLAYEDMNINTPSNSMFSSPFNVEDLVRKIDAKIAELEEEERREKEKIYNSTMKNQSTNEILESDTIVNSTIEPKEIEVPKVVNSQIADMHSSVTDDQFFDEFFDE